jgi:hypothetical protein
MYFYRCFSGSSAGGLVSGKGRKNERLSDIDLRSEFGKHRHLHAMVPTALVSVSSRIIDTLRRAFDKLYNDHENPSYIWIAFIFVPDSDMDVYHHAEDLAKKFQYEEYKRFRYEYIFTWEIPQKHLIHKVSVQTLLERGFDMQEYHLDHTLPPTRILREQVARRILNPSHGGYYIGLDLGILVRAFGARAPGRQIALQILKDCSHVVFMDGETQILSVSYADHQVIHHDFEHFRDIEDGIDTALYDWWLADSDFSDALY